MQLSIKNSTGAIEIVTTVIRIITPGGGAESELIDKDKNKSSYLPITLPAVFPPIMKIILKKSDSGALQRYF